MLRISTNENTATGRLVESQPFCFIGNKPIIRQGDLVFPHLPCPDQPQHCAANMMTASIVTYVANIGVVRESDLASCGHVADGNLFVYSI